MVSINGLRFLFRNLRKVEDYKYQYYNPDDARADGLGYVHFKTEEKMNAYIYEKQNLYGEGNK
jgi:hypothetical protein